MRIAVLSDCRVPTVPAGGHGLGRVAVDIAGGLARRGHTVALYAGPGSNAPAGVTLVTHTEEIARVDELRPGEADVWIDLSHYHTLTKRREFRQVHYLMDDECNIEPVNTVVGSAFRRRAWPCGEIVPLGVDVDAIPFDGAGGEHLLFAAKVHFLKGPDIAAAVAKTAGRALHVYGEVFERETPDGYRGVIEDNAEFYRVLGGAHALLAPARSDAGGRVLLEAAAAGTPALTFGDVGCISHVEHCVSGFVVQTPEEMAEAVADVRLLSRAAVRDWAAAYHSLGEMLAGLERLCERAADGEVW